MTGTDNTPPARGPQGMTTEERERIRERIQNRIDRNLHTPGSLSAALCADIIRLMDALAAAEADRDTAVALLIEWRTQLVEESYTRDTEMRWDAVLEAMIDYVDAHPTYRALLAKERG